MDNAVIDALKARRSIRKFKSEQIKEDELEAVLQAGMYAPTGRNRQAPIMIVVQDKETREKIRKMNAEIMGDPTTDPFYGAPTIIIVLAKKEVPTAIYDGSLVMGNLMNGAYSIGLGSCWIHRAREEFESDEGKALLKALGIEGEYIGIGHVALGYADMELPTPSPRKSDYVYRI